MSKELLPIFSSLLSFIAVIVSITALYNTYRSKRLGITTNSLYALIKLYDPNQQIPVSEW